MSGATFTPSTRTIGYTKKANTTRQEKIKILYVETKMIEVEAHSNCIKAAKCGYSAIGVRAIIFDFCAFHTLRWLDVPQCT